MANVLIIRISSLGDVALLAPVVYSVAVRYPQVRFTVMTRQAFTPLFEHLGFNVSVVPLDLRRKHKGFIGTLRIIGKALGGGYSHVADTHDVLRSKLIRFFMRLKLAKVCKIDKGRKEKTQMILSKDTSVFLPHATERYLDVFRRLGFPCELSFQYLYEFNPYSFDHLKSVVSEKVGTWIGIAPFAQHKGKIYPLSKMEALVKELSKRKNTSLFLFGAGREETKIMDDWAHKYPNIINHNGRLRLDLEVFLMSKLDAMVSMDSANMHLASLVRVPVVSVWGATHPALGFYGFGQDINNAVEINLPCRPCSVFGDTPCQFNGGEEYKCMHDIDYEVIIDKVEQVLAAK